MHGRWFFPMGFALAGLVAWGVLAARHAPRTLPTRSAMATVPQRPDAAAALRRLPLTFERNDGQLPAHVRFAGVQSNGSIAIHDDGFAIADTRSGMAPITFSFSNASPGRPMGTDPRRARAHYFTGSDRHRWHTDIPTFGRLRREELYPKIDAVYYGQNQRLEYDLVVRPGGDPRHVSIRVTGGRPRIEPATGDLVVEQRGRELRQERPVAYQEIGATRRRVTADYAIAGDGQIEIRVGPYERSVDLVIDPIIGYSSYLRATDFAIDGDGRIYLTAMTPDPTDTRPWVADLGPPSAVFGGTASRGIYVARLNAAGTGLDFSTFISATGSDVVPQIGLGPGGEIYLAGGDRDAVVPITVGRIPPDPIRMFLMALSGDGSSIRWSRYIGDRIQVLALAVRPGGGVALAGRVIGLGFVPPPDPFGASPTIGTLGPNSAWVLKVAADGSVDRPAYVGDGVGAGPSAIAVGADDTVTIVGRTVSAGLPLTAGALHYWANPLDSGFLTRFNAAQTAYEYSTYVAGGDGSTTVTDLAIDHDGNTFIAGQTTASDFPSTHDALGQCPSSRCVRVYLAKVPRAGGLAFSRHIFGDNLPTIAVTAGGEPVVAFQMRAETLPMVSALQLRLADNPAFFSSGDVAVLKFSADGARILFSTYLGGSQEDVPVTLRLDVAGNVYLLGHTYSTNFPLRRPRRANFVGSLVDSFFTQILMHGPARFDFDADARTDVSIFRPATGEWFINTGGTNVGTTTFGQSGDIPAAADFDGDGQTDFAVFRPSNGYWSIRHTSDGTRRTVQWGGSVSDIPAPADYDGDRRADPAFFRPANGYWYILQSRTSTPRYVPWGGTAADIPAPGDYDGDGTSDVAFFRPSNGYWYLNRSRAGVQYVQWGGTTADIPTPGDYDGDGRTDVAFWRPSDNYWYIRSSTTGGNRYVRWGGFASDVPVPGDYDQDGLTDQAFFRPGDGYWYILQSRTRTARYVRLGTSGDIPIPSRR